MPDGRFAPSPTGPLHLGNLRTAMLAWLFARSTKSRFLIRIDDLDPRVSSMEHARSQLADLSALGIDWDGEVVYQSHRFDRYNELINRLEDEGLVYKCFCTRREIREAASAPHGPLPEGAYPGTCRNLGPLQQAEREAEGRPAALRLRAGAVVIRFQDRICGHFEGAVDDFVIRRNDGVPAYNLAVVADDSDQCVGEVVRGDDLISTTPRQILLAHLLGLRVPRYAHVPLVLGPSGERLAKRDGAVTLADRRALGDGPEAVRTLLARSLGLAKSQQVVTMGDLLDRFDPARIPRTPWVFGSGNQNADDLDISQ